MGEPWWVRSAQCWKPAEGLLEERTDAGKRRERRHINTKPRGRRPIEQSQRERPQRGIARLHDDVESGADFVAGGGHWSVVRVRSAGATTADVVVRKSLLFRAVEHGDGFAGGKSLGYFQRARANRWSADHWRGGAAQWHQLQSQRLLPLVDTNDRGGGLKVLASCRKPTS